MNLLILGSGGREHALAWKFAQSPDVQKVFVAPGNGGIEQHAQTVNLKSEDEIWTFLKSHPIDLIFIGQEVYLVEGLADRLRAQGYAVVGPSAKAAQLEGSKTFAKAFMQRHGIPTARYAAFTTLSDAQKYVATHEAPYVLKADGLAAGKGVVICTSKEEAFDVLTDMFSGDAFGDAGKQVVIEEFMEGEEASYFVFCDGQNYLPMPACQDHKRIGENDTGLNTGGMGAYCPAPVITPELETQIQKSIVEPTLQGMNEEGHPYQGILYVGVMIHQNKARVVEYNCRFGDPECQPLMMMLQTDLLQISNAMVHGNLDQIQPQWDSGAAACVILASKGYPQSYEKGFTIEGLSYQRGNQSNQECVVFHAGTIKDGDQFKTNGGRVLGITACQTSLKAALETAYQHVSQIQWPGKTFRRDIGQKGLQ